MFLLNMLLALAWGALTGELTGTNLVIGFGIGYVLLWLVTRPLTKSNYFSRASQVTGFILFFIVELLKANFRVTYDVLTPRHRGTPGVVAVPLDVTSPAEITLLANLITLTPGTLTLDVSEDRRVMYVHTMYMDDVEAFRRGIKEGFERRVMELFRK